MGCVTADAHLPVQCILCMQTLAANNPPTSCRYHAALHVCSHKAVSSPRRCAPASCDLPAGAWGMPGSQMLLAAPMAYPHLWSRHQQQGPWFTHWKEAMWSGA